MPDASILEYFPTPTDGPIVVEHVHEEFTSVCPKTGHPDFGTVMVRFEPRGGREGGVCVELKSLKLYLHGFRNEGIFFEAVTERIKENLAKGMRPRWLQVHTQWKGRGGIRTVVRSEHGDVPARFAV